MGQDGHLPLFSRCVSLFPTEDKIPHYLLDVSVQYHLNHFVSNPFPTIGGRIT